MLHAFRNRPTAFTPPVRFGAYVETRQGDLSRGVIGCDVVEVGLVALSRGRSAEGEQGEREDGEEDAETHAADEALLMKHYCAECRRARNVGSFPK